MSTEAKAVSQTEHWRELYKAAMVELLPWKVHLLIDNARKAIAQRKLELRESESVRPEELRKMSDALDALKHWEEFNKS